MIIRSQEDKNKALNRISMLAMDKPWQVDIKPYKKNRSLAQNNLYRMWVEVIAEGLGYTHDEMHAILSNMFGEKETVEFNGDIVEVIKSTTKLTTKEFTDRLEKVDRWAAGEMGIVLPSPEDIYYTALGIERR